MAGPVVRVIYPSDLPVHQAGSGGALVSPPLQVLSTVASVQLDEGGVGRALTVGRAGAPALPWLERGASAAVAALSRRALTVRVADSRGRPLAGKFVEGVRLVDAAGQEVAASALTLGDGATHRRSQAEGLIELSPRYLRVPAGVADPDCNASDPAQGCRVARLVVTVDGVSSAAVLPPDAANRGLFALLPRPPQRTSSCLLVASNASTQTRIFAQDTVASSPCMSLAADFHVLLANGTALPWCAAGAIAQSGCAQPSVAGDLAASTGAVVALRYGTARGWELCFSGPPATAVFVVEARVTTVGEQAHRCISDMRTVTWVPAATALSLERHQPQEPDLLLYASSRRQPDVARLDTRADLEAASTTRWAGLLAAVDMAPGVGRWSQPDGRSTPFEITFWSGAVGGWKRLYPPRLYAPRVQLLRAPPGAGSQLTAAHELGIQLVNTSGLQHIDVAEIRRYIFQWGMVELVSLQVAAGKTHHFAAELPRLGFAGNLAYTITSGGLQTPTISLLVPHSVDMLQIVTQASVRGARGHKGQPLLTAPILRVATRTPTGWLTREGVQLMASMVEASDALGVPYTPSELKLLTPFAEDTVCLDQHRRVVSSSGTRVECEQVAGQVFVAAGERRRSTGHFDLPMAHDEAWLQSPGSCASVYDAQDSSWVFVGGSWRRPPPRVRHGYFTNDKPVGGSCRSGSDGLAKFVRLVPLAVATACYRPFYWFAVFREHEYRRRVLMGEQGQGLPVVVSEFGAPLCFTSDEHMLMLQPPPPLLSAGGLERSPLIVRISRPVEPGQTWFSDGHYETLIVQPTAVEDAVTQTQLRDVSTWKLRTMLRLRGWYGSMCVLHIMSDADIASTNATGQPYTTFSGNCALHAHGVAANVAFVEIALKPRLGQNMKANANAQLDVCTSEAFYAGEDAATCVRSRNFVAANTVATLSLLQDPPVSLHAGEVIPNLEVLVTASDGAPLPFVTVRVELIHADSGVVVSMTSSAAAVSDAWGVARLTTMDVVAPVGHYALQLRAGGVIATSGIFRVTHSQVAVVELSFAGVPSGGCNLWKPWRVQVSMPNCGRHATAKTLLGMPDDDDAPESSDHFPLMFDLPPVTVRAKDTAGRPVGASQVAVQLAVLEPPPQEEHHKSVADVQQAYSHVFTGPSLPRRGVARLVQRGRDDGRVLAERGSATGPGEFTFTGLQLVVAEEGSFHLEGRVHGVQSEPSKAIVVEARDDHTISASELAMRLCIAAALFAAYMLSDNVPAAALQRNCRDSFKLWAAFATVLVTTIIVGVVYSQTREATDGLHSIWQRLIFVTLVLLSSWLFARAFVAQATGGTCLPRRHIVAWRRSTYYKYCRSVFQRPGQMRHHAQLSLLTITNARRLAWADLKATKAKSHRIRAQLKLSQDSRSVHSHREPKFHKSSTNKDVHPSQQQGDLSTQEHEEDETPPLKLSSDDDVHTRSPEQMQHKALHALLHRCRRSEALLGEVVTRIDDAHAPVSWRDLRHQLRHVRVEKSQTQLPRYLEQSHDFISEAKQLLARILPDGATNALVAHNLTEAQALLRLHRVPSFLFDLSHAPAVAALFERARAAALNQLKSYRYQLCGCLCSGCDENAFFYPAPLLAAAALSTIIYVLVLCNLYSMCDVTRAAIAEGAQGQLVGRLLRLRLGGYELSPALRRMIDDQIPDAALAHAYTSVHTELHAITKLCHTFANALWAAFVGSVLITSLTFAHCQLQLFSEFRARVLLGRIGIHPARHKLANTRAAITAEPSSQASFVGLAVANTFLAAHCCLVVCGLLLLPVCWPLARRVALWQLSQAWPAIVLACVAQTVPAIRVLLERRYAVLTPPQQCAMAWLDAFAAFPRGLAASALRLLRCSIAWPLCLLRLVDCDRLSDGVSTGAGIFSDHIASSFETMLSVELALQNPIVCVAVWEWQKEAKSAAATRGKPRRLCLRRKRSDSDGERCLFSLLRSRKNTVVPSQTAEAGTPSHGDEDEEHREEWGEEKDPVSLVCWRRARNRWWLATTLVHQPELRSLRRRGYVGQQGVAGGDDDDDHDPVTPLKVAGDALLHRFFNLSSHESLPTILRANAELAEQVVALAEGSSATAGQKLQGGHIEAGVGRVQRFEDEVKPDINIERKPTDQLNTTQVNAVLGMLTDHAQPPVGPHQRGRMRGILPRLRSVPALPATSDPLPAASDPEAP